MEDLRDLETIYNSTAAKFAQYEGNEFQLPDVFKEQVKEINGSVITYYKYSAIFKTSGSLKIFMPNQWFYIASYFTDFYNELQKYKGIALRVLEKDRLKELNGKQLSEKEKNDIKALDLSETSQNYLIRFVTDYAWWGGAKTIDRGDFYVSPILNCAKLVNSTQSYVAELCVFLSDKEELVNAIISGQEKNNVNLKELLRHKFAATFLVKALSITKETDPELMRLAALNLYERTPMQLKINGFKLGRDADKLPSRKSDVDENVSWMYDSQKYVLYLEWTPIEMETLFFPAYNDAYADSFLMRKDKNGDYVLYEINQEGRKNNSTNLHLQQTENSPCATLLPALCTKPFVLLAGISGTGKSRIVRELAKASVTEELQQKYDPQSVANGFDRRSLHKPANFELVQVKPNWHNSLEVVGYKSNIGGPHYEFTPFVEFVARAWKNPTVPFFLCLDEMNLAPVEQYFAEFLSAIESRSIENGEYETDPIVKPFAEFGDEVCNDMLNHLVGSVDAANVRADSLEAKLVERFKTKGLTLPHNLLVLGTVNMDETTFSFSRKVLDRAMSIVMNDVEYDSFFSGESENTVDDMDDNMRDWLIRRPIRGLNVAEGDDLNAVKEYLKAINEKLDNTSFKLGYRAANEALLYVSAVRQLNAEANINAALDEFTLMKILSRIEGDKRSIGDLLDNLQSVITDVYPKSHAKLNNMKETLNCKQFVSYWT